jgi:predicted nucleic acid-binding protein
VSVIIADTNIVSTFVRVEAIDLLRQLVKSDRLHVTPATFHELRRAVEAGCDFLGPTLEAIQTGSGLDLVELLGGPSARGNFANETRHSRQMK